MADRIRGQETSLIFDVDGVQQDGSFSKVRNWKITPRAELTESDFVGESESEIDFMHHGYDGSCEVDMLDDSVLALYDRCVELQRAGLPQPQIKITAIHKFRDPSIPSRSDVCLGVKLKLDGHEVGDRKSYVKDSISFKFKRKGKL
jgi:hypothetical protein